jgi:hypothetical protein
LLHLKGVVLKRLIIGYGTGRCGTKSLARFLDMQPGCNIKHEGFTHQAGSEAYASDPPLFMCELLEMDGEIVGDAGYYWLNYLWMPMKCHPGTKAINIWRNPDEVVESFWSYKQQALDFDANVPWFPYPFDDRRPSKKAIARCVAKYNINEHELLKMYPGSIYRMNVNDLNNPGKLEELVDWLDLSYSPVIEPVHVNKRAEVIARSLEPKRFTFLGKERPPVKLRKVRWYTRAFRRIKIWLQDVF